MVGGEKERERGRERELERELQFKAVNVQELSHEKSPLGQVMKLTNPLIQLT